MEPPNCTREQAMLLENLRSNENMVFEDIARRALESSNTDVNFEYPHPLNKTLLDIACCEGRDDFVKILIGLGANVDRINDTHNRGPLHFATEAGHDRVIEILLKDGGANPNLRAGQQTALHVAVRNGRTECARILLEVGGADPNIVNSKGITPIHVAATTGQREIVQSILKASKIPVDIDGFRDFRKLTTRDVLLKKMPDLELPPPITDDVIDDEDNDHYDETRFLEKMKNMKEDIGELIETAARRNFPRVVERLMRKGVANDVPRFGEEAARIAVEFGHCDVLREILSINPSLANRLLLPACQELAVPTLSRRNGANDRIECLRLIMEQPNVNVRSHDDKGNSPLHYAARAESIEAVVMLLRAGSYIGHENRFGVPPLAHLSPSVLSDFFDDCLRSDNDRTDEFEIEFDYRCLMPHNVNVSRDMDNEAHQEFQISETKEIKNGGSEMNALAFIAENRALRPLLKHPLLSSFLYLKWHRIRHVLYANFIFYVIFYVLMNCYVLSTNYHTIDDEENDGDVNDTTTKLLSGQGDYRALRSFAFVALVLLAVRESLQFISSPRRYVSSLENILEVALVFLGGWVIIGADSQIGAIVVLLSAWELVILIGQHPRMSTGIEMFKTVSVNFARFLFLYAFLILAFALAFFTLFKNSKDDVNFPDPGHSLFKTIIMLTGEFDANDIPFVSHPVFSHCVFVLFVFLIAIVLFNLLNGLAVSDTADILGRSELVGLVSRTKLVSYAESVAVASGLVGLSSRCCSQSTIRRSRLNPLYFLTRRILLFSDYLPEGKIAVKPYRSNEIRIRGKANRSRRNCTRLSMDPWIVGSARQVLSRRGEITENEKTIAELETIKHKLERLEIMVDAVRLALANNNVNSNDRDRDDVGS